jgi:putative Mg2+ transporter-C (MgtC) family protein
VNPDLDLAAQLELTLRLAVALGLGALVGLERELQRQEAGFRTHGVVSLGAAIFTVVSGYAFAGVGSDPTRIAAQIVSGIGFIGAGTIIQSRGGIKGLTTAASLWAVAGVGMAAGAGLYGVAVSGTALMLVVLWLFDRMERWARVRLGLPKRDANKAETESEERT